MQIFLWHKFGQCSHFSVPAQLRSSLILVDEGNFRAIVALVRSESCGLSVRKLSEPLSLAALMPSNSLNGSAASLRNDHSRS
jgi:hypothetical protein